MAGIESCHEAGRIENIPEWASYQLIKLAVDSSVYRNNAGICTPWNRFWDGDGVEAPQSTFNALDTAKKLLGLLHWPDRLTRHWSSSYSPHDGLASTREPAQA